MRKVVSVGFAALASLVGGGAALAQDDIRGYGEGGKPLWEVEGLVIGGYEPDYLGSNQMHIHALPLPWVVYRGDILRTDDRGTVEGVLLESKRFSFDVSAKMSFPSATNDTARQGMPNLQYLGEVGPRAKMGLFYWQNYATGRLATLQLELPVRVAVSTDLSTLNYRGIDSQPALAFTDTRFLGTRARWKISAGPIFASRSMMDYFYAVPAQYAAVDRPAYTAKAGYLAGDLHTSLAVPVLDRVTAIGSVDYYAMQGAANTASPLMKDKNNISFMSAISVSLYQSTARAHSRSDD